VYIKMYVYMYVLFVGIPFMPIISSGVRGQLSRTDITSYILAFE
jgi:hypothetical protein